MTSTRYGHIIVFWLKDNVERSIGEAALAALAQVKHALGIIVIEDDGILHREFRVAEGVNGAI